MSFVTQVYEHDGWCQVSVRDTVTRRLAVQTARISAFDDILVMQRRAVERLLSGCDDRATSKNEAVAPLPPPEEEQIESIPRPDYVEPESPESA